jgi:hypothetical protein
MAKVDAKRELEKREVAHGVTPMPVAPRRSDFKTQAAFDEAVAKIPEQVKDHKKALEEFKRMRDQLGLTHDQAQELLVEYYWKPTEKGALGSETSSSAYDEYLTRGKAIAKLYKQDFFDWKNKFLDRRMEKRAAWPTAR